MEKEKIKLDYDRNLLISTPTKRQIQLPRIPKGFQNVRVIMNELFLACFCEKRYNGTRRLVLQGNDLFPRIGRCFEDLDVSDLCCFLSKNHDVTSVDLAYNKIQCRGFMSIIDNIMRYKNVLELNVQNNDISEEGVDYMCKNCEELELRSLRINGNKIGVEGAIKIASMLEQNTLLRHLDVAEIDQTISSLLYFTSVLRNNQEEYNQTLRILDLSRPNPPHMHFFDSEYFAETIGLMLRHNQSLVELHLQKCTFSCHDIEQMLDNMRYNKTLHLLDLNYNNIGDHGADLIANWLKEKPSLRGLLLAGNIISTGGARALSHGIPFSKLRLLDLSHNRIGDEGIVDLLNTMKRSPPISHFRFFGNCIDTPSVEIIQNLLAAKIFKQENIDVMPYTVNGSLCYAYYPCDHYKQRYYSVPRYGYPQPLQCTYIKDPTEDENFPKYPFKYIDPEPVINKEECTGQPLTTLERPCECTVCDLFEQSEDAEIEKEVNVENCEDLEKSSIPNPCHNCGENATICVCSDSDELSDTNEDPDTRLKQKIKLILNNVNDDLKNEILRWIPVDEARNDEMEDLVICEDNDSSHVDQKELMKKFPYYNKLLTKLNLIKIN